MSLQERLVGGLDASRLRSARSPSTHSAELEAACSSASALLGAPIILDSSERKLPEAEIQFITNELLAPEWSTDEMMVTSEGLDVEELLVVEDLLSHQELHMPDRRIRRIDLFISRTGSMSIRGSGDYLVALHIYAGSSLYRSVVTMPYSEAPSDWESWGSWFNSFVGVPSDEAMSVLYYDAEWISDQRDRMLRKALEPASREPMPFPATAFWRRNYLIESSDIHIQLSM
ncbi:hypothetical protein [Paenibacillus herberti]|uniref:Uncharacterized protein n=1 Tax=Paenibacillus herberti TaxID=1619309 RepID=A0A229NVW8_9BACL|nr:hypothetical protein [Paenibacillus herberti]OXM14027.1 hypothetical protein CGZ75_13615 [Paenibacillus herberti]